MYRNHICKCVYFNNKIPHTICSILMYHQWYAYHRLKNTAVAHCYFFTLILVIKMKVNVNKKK